MFQTLSKDLARPLNSLDKLANNFCRTCANEKSTPQEIVKEALPKAEKELYDVVLIDTAGRLAIDEPLMEELANIKKVAKPDELFYVADAMTGTGCHQNGKNF